MSKFKLAFGIHNHQPVGNFESVFEEAHQHAYQPFLQLVKKYPKLRISLHQSGILWNWQEKSHPNYLKLVREMVSSGQLELLTGGFYEPILCAIPERDVIGQIGLLSRYINKNFNVKPTGLWLAERVWEPQLPEVLSQSGVQYLPVDDTHFIYAGFDKSQLTEPYVTESNGHTVTLLPIQERLRYLIPFGTIEELFAELKRQAEKNAAGLAVYADDGEKFGVWPKTHKHCFEDGWLESFFDEIEKNSDWLEVIPLGEAAKRKPIGRAYLPTASYSEMLHWALPAPAFVEYEQFENSLKNSGQFQRFGRFVRGGHWRNFLAKYEESNLMHKKMLHISDRLCQLEKNNPTRSKKIESVRNNLFAGQCNCPYWHGVFGGLYLPHIRQAVYSELIAAETELNAIEKKAGFHVEEIDYDCDGAAEIIAIGEHFSAVFKPSRGGMLQELSLLKHNFNVTDTLSRRREGYHGKLEQVANKEDDCKTVSIHELVKTKEDNLQSFLVYDWYLKRCFIDHFFGENVTFKEFQQNQFKEDGDFVLGPYSSNINKRDRTIELSRNGTLGLSGEPVRLNVTKRFRINGKSETINVEYQIRSLDKTEVPVRFGIENNFSFQAGHADDRYITVNGQRYKDSHLDSSGQHANISSFSMIDEYRHLALAMESDQSCTLWHSPIFTVSLSEGGLEKVYQGTTFVNLFELKLSKLPAKINLTLFAGSLKDLPEQPRVKSAVNITS